MRYREAMRWIVACIVLLGFVTVCGRAFSDCPDYENGCGSGQCCYYADTCDYSTLCTVGAGCPSGHLYYYQTILYYHCYAGSDCHYCGEPLS